MSVVYVPPIKQFQSNVRIDDPIQTPKEARLLKVVLIGDVAVGKSSIIRRATGESFLKDLSSTIGVDFQDFAIGNTRFQIWDTAGQERFRSVAKQFYRGSHVVLFVFDLTNKDALMTVQTFFEEVKQHAPNASMYLIGNKSDLTAERKIVHEDALQLAVMNDMMYYETSAKTKENIMEIFQYVADHHSGGILEEMEKERLPIIIQDKTIKRKNCC